MKVEFCETVEVTGTTTITIEQIQAALIASLAAIHEEHEHATQDYRERLKRRALGGLVNDIYQCLEAIPDEAIASVLDENRKRFADSLRRHADRWAVKEVSER